MSEEGYEEFKKLVRGHELGEEHIGRITLENYKEIERALLEIEAEENLPSNCFPSPLVQAVVLQTLAKYRPPPSKREIDRVYDELLGSHNGSGIDMSGYDGWLKPEDLGK
jgi:hypothetical protein